MGTTSGTNCYDVQVPGQSQKLGLRVRPDKSGHLKPFWFGNPQAFAQPCQLVMNADGSFSPGLKPAGCVALTGSSVLGGNPATTTGPGFHRLDLSAFKAFRLNERFSMQFRAEFFKIFNHPNFKSPNFGGNGVTSIGGSGDFTNANFGQIGSTRDAPFDPRQIQFALKLYY